VVDRFGGLSREVLRRFVSVETPGFGPREELGFAPAGNGDGTVILISKSSGDARFTCYKERLSVSV
jgi:hypothetical protein